MKLRLTKIILSIILVCFTLSSCITNLEEPYNSRRMDLVVNNTSDEMFSNAYASKFLIPNHNNNVLQDNVNSVAYYIGSLDRKKSEYTKYKDPYLQLPMASLTKLMTFLVVVNNCKDFNQEYKVSRTALDVDKNSSLAGYREGELVKVIDLLYGLIVPSGNDAANVLAENLVPGGYDNFYILMNNEAERLGLKNTHFANASGLDTDYHYTSCYDMYLLMAELSKNQLFKDICMTKEYSSVINDDFGGSRTVSFKSTNLFLNQEILMANNVNLLASKTGTTTNAGNCLILLVEDKRSKTQYVSVVLNANTKRNVYNFNNTLLNGIK